MIKLRLNRTTNRFEHIIQLQRLDESGWTDVPNCRETVVRARYYGSELVHLTNRNLARAERTIQNWFNEWDDYELVEPETTRKRPGQQKTNKTNKLKCEKCGRVINVISTPIQKLCLNCRNQTISQDEASSYDNFNDSIY